MHIISEWINNAKNVLNEFSIVNHSITPVLGV